MLIPSKGWCTTITSCGVISFKMTDDQFTTELRNQLRANLKQQTIISSWMGEYIYIYCEDCGARPTKSPPIQSLQKAAAPFQEASPRVVSYGTYVPPLMVKQQR